MNETLTPHIESRTRRPATLAELKAKALPRLDFLEIVRIKEGGQLSPEDEKAMREYFRQFVSLKQPCIMCGSELTGDMMKQFMGLATFTWGLANGEGFCSKCRYPARAYHRNVGPIEFVNLVLQYHPDELEDKKARQSPDVSAPNAVGVEPLGKSPSSPPTTKEEA